ncbi:MAG: ABC transporter permease [Ignavibacteriae bacterium]|nr:ABC transporter permease [Ignavibacteriota bacterium]
MSLYIVKRIVIAIPVIVGIVTLVFVLSRVAPGDPVTHLYSPTISTTAVEQLREEFGLERPLLQQFIDWISHVARGDFGISYSHHRPVHAVILDVLPNTILLGLAAIAIEFVLGCLIGAWAAHHHNSFIDRMVSGVGLVMYTMPTFWVGLLLLYLLSYTLGAFPSSQILSIHAEHLSSLAYTVDLLKHLALPALTIAIPGSAGIARFMRSSLINVDNEDYILAARSMGINQRTISLFYKLPNALTPVITILGLELGTLMAGALVTETIFAWPGMGRLTVMAIFSRDYPLIMGCTIVAGTVVILGNLIADILYATIDPRVRLV